MGIGLRAVIVAGFARYSAPPTSLVLPHDRTLHRASSAMIFLILIAVGPELAVKVGLSEATAVLMLTMYYAGNLLLQIPLGVLADRFDRKRALIACFVVALTCPVTLPLSLEPLKWVILVVRGGATLAMYTLGLAKLGESIPRAELAGANAAFVIMCELGGVSGPLVGGGAMDLAGPHGLMLILALVAAAYLGVIAILRVLRPRRAATAHRRFVHPRVTGPARPRERPCS